MQTCKQVTRTCPWVKVTEGMVSPTLTSGTVSVDDIARGVDVSRELEDGLNPNVPRTAMAEKTKRVERRLRLIIGLSLRPELYLLSFTSFSYKSNRVAGWWSVGKKPLIEASNHSRIMTC